MTGLPYEQVLELVDRAEDYLGGWHPERGWQREMELFDAVVATLFYYRHNCSQDVTGVVFGVSQSTISRMVNILEEPIAAVLDCEVPERVEVITGRVIIPDGTLIPTGNRAAHPELYSGKRHRSGAVVQILSDTEGQLRHVGEPIVGSIHDVTAFRQTGLADVLAEHMSNNLVIADLGYLGEPVVTPVKKPPKGELSPAPLSDAVSPTSRTGRSWSPDTAGHCENSPSVSPRSLHSNSTDSTGPVLNNALDMTTDGNVTTTNWHTPDAWRTGQKPDAIMEALAMGEQIMSLLVQAAILIEEACQNVAPIINTTTVRCQIIVNQLARETARLAPIVIRLRTASGAVMVS